MKSHVQNIKELYKSCISKADEKRSLWSDISKFVGITVDSNYIENGSTVVSNKQRDIDVEDPTAALAVIQAGDYLDGIVWGSGDNAVTLEPCDELEKKVDKSVLADYYAWRTKRLLSNMNRAEAGFTTARKQGLYDLVAFGTAGVGSFKDTSYPDQSESPYLFHNYGVDNMAIDEGKNGLVDVIFIVYHWRVNRIIAEFESVHDKLPAKILEAERQGLYNNTFKIIQGIYPRDNYKTSLKGKKGTKYCGVWFCDEGDDDIFLKEDFRRLPVGVCRLIKVRGDVWGSSGGSILISTIKATNYIFSQAVENIEKMNDPALGIWNGALFGDSVVDTSSGGMVVFNQSMMGKASGNPMFKLYDTGDPTPIISFLLPYLNDKIATGFKTDILLDFNNENKMTATESMHRYAIRGKSAAGMLSQIKNELLEPIIDRCLQIEDDNGFAGINPVLDAIGAREAKEANKAEIIIPDVVYELMKNGKRWYKIKYNNELERLSRTEVLDRILQALNAVSMMATVYPAIIEAVDWFKMWTDINEYLGVSYMVSADEFKDSIVRQAKIQEQAMMLQGAQMGADAKAKMSRANKDDADAGKSK